MLANHDPTVPVDTIQREVMHGRSDVADVPPGWQGVGIPSRDGASSSSWVGKDPRGQAGESR